MGMGFKLKINRLLLLFSIFLVLLCCVSLVSASTNNQTDSINSDNTTEITLESVEDDADEPYSSSNINTEELKSTDNIIVNQRNFKMYFDDDGVLKKEYGGKTLTFDGSFKDKGTITIDSPNTIITGRNAVFYDTVFGLKADGVVLSNINFILNKTYPTNAYSGIFIKADNVTVSNVNINYKVPNQGTGFAIRCNNNYDDITDVKLINNTINFVGNDASSGYNYGVILLHTENAIVSGNKIICKLPLRDVDWSGQIFIGSTMDSVAGFVADNCPNLLFSKNNISIVVNKRTGGTPTLDGCLIYKCDNAIIEYNNIYEEDNITPKGTVNYLYGMDLYLSENVVVYKNNISLYTTGGKEGMGTAYPIQVSGTSNVQIAFNRITSYSNGPNLGIYSNNFYGPTRIDIMSNFINITGYASSHPWALVAGIEVQDSDDKIMNNTIIVNTVNKFKNGYNVYGISYSQKTGGTHKYNIQYNNVTTNGQHAVALKGGNTKVSDSIIANNILKTAYAGGDKAAIIITDKGKRNIIANNTDGSTLPKQMSDDEYNDLLRNYLTPPSKGEGQGFSGEGKSFIGTGEGTGLNGLNSGNGIKNNGFNGFNPNPSKSQAHNGNVNSTMYTYGSSGVDIASASSSSGAGGRQSQQSDNPKAYEITKQIEELDEMNNIQTIVLILLAIGLLVVGYRQKREQEEY